MQAGALRRRLLFQRRGTERDIYSQPKDVWIDVLANVPAAITPLAGRELVQAQALNAEVTHAITVRYHRTFADPIAAANMRAVYRPTGDVTRYFNLHGLLNVDERNRQIDIAATEGLNQA